jgi:hypothetical protein
VAHRALAPREDHHRLLRRQPRHPLRHRRRLLGFSTPNLLASNAEDCVSLSAVC